MLKSIFRNHSIKLLRHMAESDNPVEIYVDHSSEAIFGPQNSKVVFSTIVPSRDGNKNKDVLTLVMPTDSLLTLCLELIESYGRNGEAIAENVAEGNDTFREAVAAVRDVVATEQYSRIAKAFGVEGEEEVPKRSPAKRRRTKAKVH